MLFISQIEGHRQFSSKVRIFLFHFCTTINIFIFHYSASGQHLMWGNMTSKFSPCCKLTIPVTFMNHCLLREGINHDLPGYVTFAWHSIDFHTCRQYKCDAFHAVPTGSLIHVVRVRRHTNFNARTKLLIKALLTTVSIRKQTFWY